MALQRGKGGSCPPPRKTEMGAWQKIICKTGRTAWQKSLVQQLGRRNFGRKRLNFGRMKLLAPLKNDPDTPMIFLADYHYNYLLIRSDLILFWHFHQFRCTSPCTGPDTDPPVTETCAKLYAELAVNEESKMAKAIMHETVMNRVLNTTSEYRVNGGRVHLQWLTVKSFKNVLELE